MKDASISLEALWITFTILFIVFLLCFLIWLISRHYGWKHHRTFAEDDEAQRGFLKELAKEFGYRDSKHGDLRHANNNFNRNSYNAFCTSSLRSSLIQYGNHQNNNSNSNRPSSGLHNNSYNSSGDGSRPNSGANYKNSSHGQGYGQGHSLDPNLSNNIKSGTCNNNNSNRCSKSNATVSMNSQMLEVITEDEEIGDS